MMAVPALARFCKVLLLLTPPPTSAAFLGRPHVMSRRCLFFQSLLGTYLYVPVEVSEDFPGEVHTKPQNVKVGGQTGRTVQYSRNEVNQLRVKIQSRVRYSEVQSYILSVFHHSTETMPVKFFTAMFIYFTTLVLAVKHPRLLQGVQENYRILAPT